MQTFAEAVGVIVIIALCIAVAAGSLFLLFTFVFDRLKKMHDTARADAVKGYLASLHTHSHRLSDYPEAMIAIQELAKIGTIQNCFGLILVGRGDMERVKLKLSQYSAETGQPGI